MRSLFPAIEPFNHFYLNVKNDVLGDEGKGEEHKIYVEQCGNPEGIPVVFLHGGLGSGCQASHRSFFDPRLYHIILFDQRGCGRSRPYGSLNNNTTDHLIQDIESIRKKLGIKRWMVFGGSWGATLGLCYANQFAKRVTGLILRGVFLARQQDIDWVYSNNGAAKLYPQAWHDLVENIPLNHQDQPISTVFQMLTSNDVKLSDRIFNKLRNWEASLINWQKTVNMELSDTNSREKAPSIIQLYYSMNQCFIDKTPLLELIKNIRHIPTKIIHGRHDMVCPFEQAWLLKEKWPEAELSVVEKAGHVASEPKITDALIQATNDFGKNMYPEFMLSK